MTEPKTRWNVGKSRKLADLNAGPIEKVVIKSEREKKIVKAFESVIGRRAYEGIQQIRNELFEQIQVGVGPDKMRLYQETQAMTFMMSSAVLDEMEQKEMAKTTPNKKAIQWIQSTRIELMKASSEIRKAIESEHDMRFGKKNINITKTIKGTVQEWMDAEKQETTKPAEEITDGKKETNENTTE